jgi:hypothetical protein
LIVTGTVTGLPATGLESSPVVRLNDNKVGTTLSIGGVGVAPGVVPTVGVVGGKGVGVRHGVGVSRGDRSECMDWLYPVAWVLGIKMLVNPRKRGHKQIPEKRSHNRAEQETVYVF